MGHHRCLHRLISHLHPIRPDVDPVSAGVIPMFAVVIERDPLHQPFDIEPPLTSHLAFKRDLQFIPLHQQPRSVMFDRFDLRQFRIDRDGWGNIDRAFVSGFVLELKGEQDVPQLHPFGNRIAYGIDPLLLFLKWKISNQIGDRQKRSDSGLGLELDVYDGVQG